jgi:hypothetical protein
MTKVQKALSAEEATLLSNIRSMVDELEQINAGEATASYDPEDKMEKMDGEEEELDIVIAPEDDEEEGMMKARKSDEGPTANDKAEERLETTDEESEKNIAAVKALIARMDRKLRAEKSKSQQTDVVVLKAIKMIAKRQDEIEEAFTHILKGMGVADQIEKSIVSKPKEKPVQSTDVAAVLKSLLGQAAPAQEPAPRDSNEVRKSLASRSVLTALLGQQ